jgi:hypothetical protein
MWELFLPHPVCSKLDVWMKSNSILFIFHKRYCTGHNMTNKDMIRIYFILYINQTIPWREILHEKPAFTRSRNTRRFIHWEDAYLDHKSLWLSCTLNQLIPVNTPLIWVVSFHLYLDLLIVLFSCFKTKNLNFSSTCLLRVVRYRLEPEHSTFYTNHACKVIISVTGRGGWWGCGTSMLPKILDNWHTDGAEVVHLTYRQQIYLDNIPGTHFCQRLSRSKGHCAAGRIRSIEKSNYLFENRTQYLPACSTVTYPTTLLRAPHHA